METSKQLKSLILGIFLLSSNIYAGDFNFDGDIYVDVQGSSGNGQRADGSGKASPDLTINSRTVDCKKESAGHISLKYLKTLMLGEDLTISRVSSDME